MSASLVGSEMCIRDSATNAAECTTGPERAACPADGSDGGSMHSEAPVSYTHLTLPTICSV
eukprot:1152705-Alexandrium_andersonii.AAC.1